MHICIVSYASVAQMQSLLVTKGHISSGVRGGRPPLASFTLLGLTPLLFAAASIAEQGLPSGDARGRAKITY